MKFKAGDRVKHEEYGVGTVVGISNLVYNGISYGVRFDNAYDCLNNLGCFGVPECENHHGWFCSEEELALDTMNTCEMVLQADKDGKTYVREPKIDAKYNIYYNSSRGFYSDDGHNDCWHITGLKKFTHIDNWKLYEPVKEVTMAEVEKKFGCKVKIVKGENQ